MMKKLFLLFFMFVLALTVMAQSTQKITYQAVVRDGANRLVVHTPVRVDVTITYSSGSYFESLKDTTNANGLMYVLIGGNPGFESINWENALIKTVVTIDGGETVTDEVLMTAVPYALQANYTMNVSPTAPTIVAVYNQLQADSLALANRIAAERAHLDDTLNNYLTINALCDSIVNCDIITNLQHADSVLSTRFAKDSIALSAKIHSDSIYFKGLIDSSTTNITNNTTNITNNTTNISNITNYITQLQATDSVLNARFAKDSIALSKRLDTLFTHLCDSIEQCELITNLQRADSLLGSRITADSTNLANNYYNKGKINDTISHLLNQMANTSGNLNNNYYTQTEINDTLGHYTTSNSIDSLLGDYEKKAELCNDVMSCTGIQTMQTNITNVANNLDSTKVNIRNEINNKVTKLQNADSVLAARITRDSILSYKADSILAVRITRDSIVFHKTDSVLASRITRDSILFHKTDSVLASRITRDSILSYKTDSILSARITADSTNLANNYYNKGKINDTIGYILGQITNTSDLLNNYYNKDKINDTLGHYTTSNSIDSLLRNYAKKDTLKNYLTIDGLCDSLKNCNIISSLQNSITNNTTNITHNTTNITNNTTNITNLQVADSALEVRIYNDSVALSKRMDTLFTHLRDSIGNGTLTINVNDGTPTGIYSTTAFKANDKEDKTVTLAKVASTGSYNDLSNTPTIPTVNDYTVTVNLNGNPAGSFTLNQSSYAEVNLNNVAVTNTGTTNKYYNDNDFTEGTITVPSNENVIPRPSTASSATCNNNNAVAVCDLLAVFDSLNSRIKKLEDEIASMNQTTTSAVSVSLSEITKTSLKATATMNDPNLNVTSYEFCISESSSMSDDTCGTSTSNEYTFTGLKPNTVYYVTVKAYHSSGSPISDVASGKTLPLTLDISISPASPVCLCDGNSTTVTYTANIEDADTNLYSFSWHVQNGDPEPDNSGKRVCKISYTESKSYTVNCTATLKADPTIQLTADTTVTVQNCTTPTITTCETDLTVTVMNVTGNPDFIDWNDGQHTGTSVSKNSSNTYDTAGVYVIEVSKDGCSYKHTVALGEAALYPCSVSDAHTNSTVYTGSSTSPGTGGLETETSAGSNQITHVTDQDGNTYPVVQIGNQCWMAKNLRTTHYSDEVEEITLSQPMPNNSNHQYDDIENKAYRYAPALGMDYLSSWGYYYNWKAAMHGTTNQGICPKGWHLPSKEEWETMATVVNGSDVVFPYSNYAVHSGTLAGKLSTGCNWKPIYTEINSYPEGVGQEGAPGDYNNPERNASGFSSIPTGWITGGVPNLYDKHTYAYYWSSTYNPNNSGEAYALFWNHNTNDIACVPLVTINVDHRSAVSVRCLRDEMALTSYPTLSVTPSATSLLFCPGTSESVNYTAAVTVNGVTKTNEYSYTWKVTNTTTNTTETLSDHSPHVTIAYSDSANYKVSCVAKANSNTPGDSATNSVMTLIKFKVAPSFNPSVSGLTVTLNDIEYVSKVKWASNGEVVNLPTPPVTHTYNEAGSYEITAYSPTECSLTKPVDIQVTPTPSLSIVQSDSSTSNCSTSITYTANLTNATANSHEWHVTGVPSDGFNAPTDNTTNPYMVTFTKAGSYTVSCTVTTSTDNVQSSVQTNITGLDTPDFTIPVSVSGDTVTLNNLAYTNQIIWDNDNADTTTQSLVGYPTSAKHTYKGTPGTHTYTIVATNTATGCSKTVENVAVTIPLAAPTQTSDPVISDIATDRMTVTPHFSGTIDSYTYCISTNNNMSSANCSGAVTETTHTFTGLTPNTDYYVQVTATNTGGTTTSTIVPAHTQSSSGGGGFSTVVDTLLSCVILASNNQVMSSQNVPNSLSNPTTPWESNSEKGRTDQTYIVVDSVRDYEGHWYKVVQIGSQCWLKENLRSTQYWGETSSLSPNTSTLGTDTKCYYYPNKTYVADTVKKYGLLYNWYTAMNGSTAEKAQGICPQGWHIPSDGEWTEMQQVVHYMNNGQDYNNYGQCTEEYAGKLVTNYWQPTNNMGQQAYPGNMSYSYRNEYGFSALPAGWIVNIDLNNFTIRQNAAFWSSTSSATNKAYRRLIQHIYAKIIRNDALIQHAYSVRCVRD